MEKQVLNGKKLNKLRIIADEKIPFLNGVLEPFAEVKYMPGNSISREAAMHADALLIRTRTKCDASLLDGTPVKFIATATIGFDHIDTGYCRSKNIHWTNAPGCNSSSVQQYIIAALLVIAQKNEFKLVDKTLGVIGVGNVGKKVETAARLLGMNVVLNDPPRARREGTSGFADLEKLLEHSDIISLHVPLNKEGEDKTFHFIDETAFAKIKDGAWLINSSRGEVMESEAVKAALSSGKLGGAILDVWENEPDVDIELLHAAQISTPHIAGYSTDGKANGTAQVVNSLCTYFNLPLSGFYPPQLPEPASLILTIDGRGKPCLQIIQEAVSNSYSIRRDHIRLQLSPDTFEQQRSSYPIRREFPAYTIKLVNCKPEAGEILKSLGFNLIIE
jgi:erythronate-4-phosphate dehydrogenase